MQSRVSCMRLLLAVTPVRVRASSADTARTRVCTKHLERRPEAAPQPNAAEGAEL